MMLANSVAVSSSVCPFYACYPLSHPCYSIIPMLVDNTTWLPSNVYYIYINFPIPSTSMPCSSHSLSPPPHQLFPYTVFVFPIPSNRSQLLSPLHPFEHTLHPDSSNSQPNVSKHHHHYHHYHYNHLNKSPQLSYSNPNFVPNPPCVDSNHSNSDRHVPPPWNSHQTFPFLKIIHVDNSYKLCSNLVLVHMSLPIPILPFLPCVSQKNPKRKKR
mmetsp:Transcript_1881/g.3415  ORF Transcript_1881/g.3415 Transcript_1881/m.3415 type:complete len:214 (-) Transcript_1881:1289-1930(-)